MNLSRSSSDNNTNTLGRNAVSSATSPLMGAQSFPNLTTTGTTSTVTMSTSSVTSSNVATATTGLSVGQSLSNTLTTSLTSTSSESDTGQEAEYSLYDFLDSCRASTLLAELDDDEDLPEPDEEDDENEDDNQEEQEYEEVMEEEEYETKGGRRRTWDDDYVLKRQFSALVPAFDPRPGRTNVQQTTDLEIPAPGASSSHLLRLQSTRRKGFFHNLEEVSAPSGYVSRTASFRRLDTLLGLLDGTPHSELLEEVECAPAPRLALTLKVTGLGNGREVELPLSNFRSTIFYYVQKLLQLSCNGAIKSLTN
ncbi:unnamed protein product [Ranitomeya imitator]|uniref:Uncharacterized protein n=1 Tax=Ranitomeya imitator TaxID=111125 RepID=A0ABN9L855_9NEOB|nr:unnamed protein product [Ranitomeya imitator]